MNRLRTSRLRSRIPLVVALVTLAWGQARGADEAEPIPAPPAETPSRRSLGSVFGDSIEDDADRRIVAEFTDPHAAEFGEWESLTDGGLYGDDRPDLRPFDWMRKFGFHHSSTEGPYLNKNVPMQRTSWMNRPYHIDWFVGPILGDELDGNSVEQQSSLFKGLRAGWDFDYYWGLEWRFGWAQPDINATTSDVLTEGRYFASDVDVVYYPWGDTKVRPYLMLGMGLAEVDTFLGDGQPEQATLLTMPFGGGVMLPLSKWAAFRLDLVDNVAFGGDGVDTLNNFSFTAGMEFRFGARPGSYWPWRTSRTVW